MTTAQLPPPAPSVSDLEGWSVRMVTSAHRTPETAVLVNGYWRPVAWKPGTISVATSDVESFNGLLRLVDELSREYGYRAEFCQVTDTTFRWTWERWNQDGTHVSDMIIASRIGD